MSDLTVEPILVRIPIAAATLGRSKRFIYQLIATKQIEAVKSGRSLLVRMASLHRYAANLPPAKIKPITRRANGERRRPTAPTT